MCSVSANKICEVTWCSDVERERPEGGTGRTDWFDDRARDRMALWREGGEADMIATPNSSL